MEVAILRDASCGEAQNGNSDIDCVVEDLLHVVVFRLREIKGCELFKSCKMFDIMGAFAAEMDAAAAEFFQKLLVKRHDVFFIHIARDVHDGIVAEHDVAMMAEAPMAGEAVGGIRIFFEPAF